MIGRLLDGARTLVAAGVVFAAIAWGITHGGGYRIGTSAYRYGWVPDGGMVDTLLHLSEAFLFLFTAFIVLTMIADWVRGE